MKNIASHIASQINIKITLYNSRLPKDIAEIIAEGFFINNTFHEVLDIVYSVKNETTIQIIQYITIRNHLRVKKQIGKAVWISIWECVDTACCSHIRHHIWQNIDMQIERLVCFQIRTQVKRHIAY